MFGLFAKKKAPLPAPEEVAVAPARIAAVLARRPATIPAGRKTFTAAALEAANAPPPELDETPPAPISAQAEPKAAHAEPKLAPQEAKLVSPEPQAEALPRKKHSQEQSAPAIATQSVQIESEPARAALQSAKPASLTPKEPARDPAVAPEGSASAKGTHKPGGFLTRVVIPRGAFEAAKEPGEGYRLPLAVVDFVNDVMTAGAYAYYEMPERAAGLYFADYYLAQTNNGGHGQFLRNTQAPYVFDYAARGLADMGAQEHLALFEEALALQKAHPEQFVKAHDFDMPRPPTLEDVDRRFFALQEKTPLVDLEATWIASWPELDRVEDEAYPGLIEQMGALNPKREARAKMLALDALRVQLHERFLLALAVTCGSITEPKLELGRGRDREIEGVVQPAFDVRTVLGPRWFTWDGARGRLHEVIEHSPKPSLENVTWETVTAWRPPEAGPLLTEVDTATVDQFGDVAMKQGVADAAHLLLTQLGWRTDAQLTAWSCEGAQSLWLVAVPDKDIFVIAVDAAGAALMPFEQDAVSMVRVTRAEIEAHIAEIDASRP
jgi:hypothetical protein